MPKLNQYRYGLIYKTIIILVLAYAFLFSETVTSKLTVPIWIRWVYNPQFFFFISSVAIYTYFKLWRIEYQCPKLIIKWCAIGVALTVMIYTIMFILSYAVGETTNTLKGLTWSTKDWFVLLLLAPISEELFFRGILFRALKTKQGWVWGMLFSSLLFMATHSGLMIGAFCLGLITSWMTYQSKSIVPGILFHALSNTFVYVAHRFTPKLGALENILFF